MQFVYFLFLLVRCALRLMLSLGNLGLILAKLTVYDVKLFVITAFNGFFKLYLFFVVGLGLGGRLL